MCEFVDGWYCNKKWLDGLVRAELLLRSSGCNVGDDFGYVVAALFVDVVDHYYDVLAS